MLFGGKGETRQHNFCKPALWRFEKMTITQNAMEVISNTFNFNVPKVPLYGMLGNEKLETGELFGLYRDDTWQIVNRASVTKGYHPHTTDDVLALVEATSSLFEGDCNVQCHFNSGHYVSIQPTDEYRRQVYGERDNVWPRVMISAGYDGKPFRAAMDRDWETDST